MHKDCPRQLLGNNVQRDFVLRGRKESVLQDLSESGTFFRVDVKNKLD